MTSRTTRLPLCINLHYQSIPLKILYYLIFLFPTLCLSSTCPNSHPNLYPTTKDQHSFQNYGQVHGYAVVSMPISGSLYYMYQVLSPNSAVVRKEATGSNQNWISAIGGIEPAMKSLSVDSNEIHVYFSSYTSVMNVCRLMASSGSIDITITL